MPRDEIWYIILFTIANPNKNSLWTNPFIKCLWFFLVLFLCILAIGGVIIFYLVCGAGYEFLKCYYDDSKKEDDDYDEDASDVEAQVHKRRSNSSSMSEETKKKTKCREYTHVTLLMTLGIFVQPFYLLFKVIEMMMECYRRFGCWFYYFTSY